MPRFTIKDLLIATALVAIGAAMFAAATHEMKKGEGPTYPFMALIAFFGLPVIGAGLFAPFKRPWTAAIVVAVLQILFIFAALVHGVP